MLMPLAIIDASVKMTAKQVIMPSIPLNAVEYCSVAFSAMNAPDAIEAEKISAACAGLIVFIMLSLNVIVVFRIELVCVLQVALFIEQGLLS